VSWHPGRLLLHSKCRPKVDRVGFLDLIFILLQGKQRTESSYLWPWLVVPIVVEQAEGGASLCKRLPGIARCGLYHLLKISNIFIQHRVELMGLSSCQFALETCNEGTDTLLMEMEVLNYPRTRGKVLTSILRSSKRIACQKRIHSEHFAVQNRYKMPSTPAPHA
jgi:hypothetical protein